MRAKIQLFFQIARIILRILTLFAHKKCSFFHGSRYIMYGNSPEQLNSITTMNRKALFWPLAAMLLTACEKGLDEGIADVAPLSRICNPAALNMSICNATTPAASNMSICNATTPIRKSGLQILILTAVGLQIRPSGDKLAIESGSKQPLFPKVPRLRRDCGTFEV